MAWALINSTGNLWISGPHETEPTPAAGQYVVVVALGYPDVCEWSPSRAGFVDIVTPTATITKLQFQRRFTMAERVAIRNSANTAVQDYMALSQLATDIELTDADVIAGVQYLETLALIDTGRADEILTI